MSGAKSCQGSVTRPEEATPPFFPLLHSGPQPRVTTVSPGFCRTVLRLPPTTLSFHSRGCGQGQHRAASPKLSTLIPSPRPEFELQEACPPMIQRLERAGLASWGGGVKKELTWSNPRGKSFFTLSPPSWRDVTAPRSASSFFLYGDIISGPGVPCIRWRRRYRGRPTPARPEKTGPQKFHSPAY